GPTRTRPGPRREPRVKSPRVKWLVRSLIVVVCGATGWLAGNASGPWHIELSSTAIGLCGIAVGSGVAVGFCPFAKGREEARERNRHYSAMVETHLRPTFGLSSFGPRRLAAGLVKGRSPRTAPAERSSED